MATLLTEMDARQAVNVRVGCPMVTAHAPNRPGAVVMVLHRHAILVSMAQSGSQVAMARCLRPRLRVGAHGVQARPSYPCLLTVITRRTRRTTRTP
jgi:hypothetical protein